mmetsp:Transcript_1146/g.1856  ORF Transcript_1146/g.1856 Transcript_1146/m.1856 type:complete len:543 (+) Transcript_1146:134-1762(+)|eukprot:CAMPEP_0185039596 /NCGR_PEP_ID=MMETSP1103-20130426/36600_1 /TAXON_ID=36769 /ORGANISM="Paraphysomonas bandaiensis, Strain Caron Lab Isolate" /LENGTH=542 /DNA_ID=CAMNT_0027578541 /DNA_START=35 /DNA_END=1663 /DNA_ORIENTATION=-
MNAEVPAYTEICIPISDVSDVERFDWPNSSDGTEIWRHITDYILYDGRTWKHTDLLVDIESDVPYRLRGKLLPSPEEIDQSHTVVEIPIKNYAVDYGESVDDPDRGFWLLDFDGAWYKLETPLPEYSSTAAIGRRKCKEYLKFYDAIVYGRQRAEDGEKMKLGRPLADFNRRTGRWVCRKDIATAHKASNYFFNLDYIARCRKFFYDRALTAFDPKCELMKSLNKLPKSVPSKVGSSTSISSMPHQDLSSHSTGERVTTSKEEHSTTTKKRKAGQTQNTDNTAPSEIRKDKNINHMPAEKKNEIGLIRKKPKLDIDFADDEDDEDFSAPSTSTSAGSKWSQQSSASSSIRPVQSDKPRQNPTQPMRQKKSLQPDWEIRAERLAEERRRTMESRWRLVGAHPLGTSNLDPKSRLHYSSSGVKPPVKTIPVVETFSKQLGVTVLSNADPELCNAVTESQVVKPPPPENSSYKPSHIKWADTAGKRLFEVNYIDLDQMCFPPGQSVSRDNRKVMDVQWNSRAVFDDDDDDDHGEGERDIIGDDAE